MDRRKKALTAHPRPQIFQIAPTKYIELPEGYLAFARTIRAGVWYGAIQHVDGEKEIIYYHGAVQNAVREENPDIKYQRFRSTTYGTIKYAVEEKNGKKRFLAENNEVNFESDIDTYSEIDDLLRIIKIVRNGSCQPCKSLIEHQPSRPTLRRRSTETRNSEESQL